MPTTLSNLRVSARISARLLNTFAGNSVQALADEVGLEFLPATTLAGGTAAGQADRLLFAQDVAITSGNTLDLNMYNGTNWQGLSTTEDLLGNALTLAEIVALLIHCKSTSVGNLVIGGQGTANAWLGGFNANTSTWTLSPDGIFVAHRPSDPAYTVASGSNNLLRLAASGGNVTFSAIALGRSA